jgi:1,2-diacylglycerol 3-beta-glucosyltransferase
MVVISVTASILIALAALVLWLPTISDGLAVLRILVGGRRARHAATTATPRFLFLIPAHDEELLIGPCLVSIAAVDYPTDHVATVVVADNCTDATAAIARAAGVRVLERTDTTQRGKPWAIAWALPQVMTPATDAVIILDADSLLDPPFLRALASHAPLDGKIVQGYIDVSNPGETALTRMALVWSAIRFRIINALKDRVGNNVPLGDGVCIGRQVLAVHGWTAFSLSETWELYGSMTAAGVRCEGEPDAHLYAQEARSLKQSASQRQRWTAGRLIVLGRFAPAILRNSKIPFHQRLDALAEMTALGPAAQLAVCVALAALAWPIGLWLVVFVLGALVRPIVYTIIAVARGPERVRTMLAFLYLPIYAVWRVGIQLLSFTKLGGSPWLRTGRHSQAQKEPPAPSA